MTVPLVRGSDPSVQGRCRARRQSARAGAQKRTGAHDLDTRRNSDTNQPIVSYIIYIGMVSHHGIQNPS
eukprot:6760385-Pyramimonas_sp.AAC.1